MCIKKYMTMKKRAIILGALSTLIILITVFLTACKEDISGPDTVPIRAEIKQVIINNSIYISEIMDEDKDDALDSVIVTVPQGTDITQLEMDIIYSYFGSIEPEPAPVSDLTNPLRFTITSKNRVIP